MTGTTRATSRPSRPSRSPTSIKAYAAGAHTTWPAYWLHTYTDYAEQLDGLTEADQAADPGIGD